MTQSTTRPRTDKPGARAPGAIIGRIVRANLPIAELYEDAVRAGEGLIAAEGPLVVRTGKHTGRSPQDKFLVREKSSESRIWWGEVNRPIALEHYDRLRARLMTYLADRPVYAQDCFIGAHPDHHRRPLSPGPGSGSPRCRFTSSDRWCSLAPWPARRRRAQKCSVTNWHAADA